MVFFRTVDCEGNAGFLKSEVGLLMQLAFTIPSTLLVGILEMFVAMLFPGRRFSLPGAMLFCFSDLMVLSI